MNYHFQLLLCSLYLFSFGQQQPTNKSFDIDKIFIDWNKSTISSIEKSILTTKNNAQENLYKNRLNAFKIFNNTLDTKEIDINSIRYKFLEQIKKDGIYIRDFYIIEANHSGEQIEIRNFVIYQSTENNFKIKVYEFKNNLWYNKSSYKNELKLNDNLKMNLVKFGNGFNQDDVIITKIKNNKINYSEFYLFTTLSTKWKQILSK
ncbi:hypothetical protein [Flavobacterium psychrophilum]|uniref:hypothetical protein n=1 Tax=Flavobacterium psychrophilum TaxID=96345 RepID=UPI001D06B38F|nr:hypothetical protein [Flavobacterium psychrophilum]MCB6089670.1 hypothetical protein [Flavobacterium psychrophilum]MEB3378726.1 hypothetical protein [Flavobacterium psychrophilum]